MILKVKKALAKTTSALCNRRKILFHVLSFFACCFYEEKQRGAYY